MRFYAQWLEYREPEVLVETHYCGECDQVTTAGRILGAAPICINCGGDQQLFGPGEALVAFLIH